MDEQKLNKWHALVSLFAGVVFLVFMQAPSSPRLNYSSYVPFEDLWPWFLAYIAAFIFYNRWYLRRLGKYNIWIIVRQVILIVAAAALFLVAPTPFTRGLFLLLSVPVIAFFEATVAGFSENLLLNQTLLSAFGIFTGFGAWAYLYSPSLRFYMSIGVFAFIFLISRAILEFAPRSSGPKSLSALALALLTGEVFWAAGFLPHYYTALGLALTAFYYAGLIVNYHYLFDNLDFKKIQFHLIVAGACVGLVFLSTPWTIAN